MLIGPAEVRPDADLNKTPLYKDVQEDNLWGWGKIFMDDYYKQFDFKCVGPHEEAEIREYFKSDHFKKWLRLIDDSPADHPATAKFPFLSEYPWSFVLYLMLSTTINTPSREMCPHVTGDGKYFFFNSFRNGNADNYWVSAEIIEELRAKRR